MDALRNEIFQHHKDVVYTVWFDFYPPPIVSTSAPSGGRVRSRSPRLDSGSASAALATAHSCDHMRCGCSTRRIAPEASSALSSSASRATKPETSRKSLRDARPRRTWLGLGGQQGRLGLGLWLGPVRVRAC